MFKCLLKACTRACSHHVVSCSASRLRLDLHQSLDGIAQGASLNCWSVLQWTRQLVSKGNKVIGSCRNPAEAAELKKIGVAHVAKLDVTDPSSIEVVAADF